MNNGSITYFFRLDFVWALNADKAICSSEGLQVDKPIQAQFITQATFVPSDTFAGKS